MRAIILAAGAYCLRPLTNDRPTFVSVGEKALVDHQIDALRSVGVDDIVLVVGCKADQVRAPLWRVCALYRKCHHLCTTKHLFAAFSPC